MKIKLSNAEIQEYVIKSPTYEFPKYTTQIMNLANQNSQATRPKFVGQMTDLIQEFPGRTFEEWVIWYQERYPNAIDEATDKIITMLEKLTDAIDKVDRTMVKAWVEDLVLVKTYTGLKFQEAILRKLSEIKGCDFRLAEPFEESQGIDGYVGEEAYSIKPRTYEGMQFLSETIDIKTIIYDKKKNGIEFEIEDDE